MTVNKASVGLLGTAIQEIKIQHGYVTKQCNRTNNLCCTHVFMQKVFRSHNESLDTKYNLLTQVVSFDWQCCPYRQHILEPWLSPWFLSFTWQPYLYPVPEEPKTLWRPAQHKSLEKSLTLEKQTYWRTLRKKKQAFLRLLPQNASEKKN